MVFLVPLGHGKIKMWTLIGENVGERLKRLGSFLGDHVEEQRDAVATPWVGEDRLFLFDGEVLGGTQRWQDGGDVHRLDQLLTGPLQAQPLARHQRRRHYHDSPSIVNTDRHTTQRYFSRYQLNKRSLQTLRQGEMPNDSIERRMVYE